MLKQEDDNLRTARVNAARFIARAAIENPSVATSLVALATNSIDQNLDSEDPLASVDQQLVDLILSQAP